MSRLWIASLGLFVVSQAYAGSIRSDQDLKFFQITSYDRPPQYLGFTSSKLDNFVKVPANNSWFVRPDGRMNEEKYAQLIQEIREKHIPGLDVSDRWDISNSILASLAGTDSLKILRLSNTKISDAGLSVLERLPSLEVLVLNNQVTDAGLKWIKGLKRLEALELHHAKVTDAGLAVLKELPRLEMLDLSEAQISDAGARVIGGLKTLRQLDVSGTHISDKGITLLASLPKLEILYVNDTMTDRGLKLVSEAKHLKVLDLSGAQVTDAGMKALRQSSRLEALALSDTRIGDTGLENVAALKNLKTLELSGTLITREGLAALAGMPRLETLSLGWGELSGPELRALGDLPKLTRVILNGRTLGQEVLSRIRVMAKKSLPIGQSGLPGQAAPDPMPRRALAGVAPTTHPGGKTLSPQRVQEAKGSPANAVFKPSSLPRDLPPSPPATSSLIDDGSPKGKGMMIEVGAAPSYRSGKVGARRLTGLKRLRQIELSQGPRDIDLLPGASPVIGSSDPDPANSLGEITVDSR